MKEEVTSKRFMPLKTLLAHVSEGMKALTDEYRQFIVLTHSVKAIRMNDYSSLYRIYRLRQLLYIWSKVGYDEGFHVQRWINMLYEIINSNQETYDPSIHSPTYSSPNSPMNDLIQSPSTPRTTITSDSAETILAEDVTVVLS